MCSVESPTSVAGLRPLLGDPQHRFHTRGSLETAAALQDVWQMQVLCSAGSQSVPNRGRLP